MPKRKIESSLEDGPRKSRKELLEEDENEGNSDENDSEFEGLQDSEEDSGGEVDFDNEELEDESDDEEQEDVQIEFCAFNPEKEDFHGIRQLLDRLWLKEPVDTNKISDFIIEKQSQFATLLRQVDDDAPEVEEKPKPELGQEGEEELPEDDFDQVYSLLTVIPFNEQMRKESPELVEDLQKWLLNKLPEDSPIREKINASTAYLISERFINMPINASIPCYEGLLKDLNGKMEYEFENIVMQIKLVKDKKTGKEVIYTNPEEELFDEKADGWFEYSVADQCDSDVFDWKDGEKLYEPFRKIVVIGKEKWSQVIGGLKKEILG